MFGGRGGYGTASLRKELIQISQVCITICILINETLFSDFSDWESTSLTFGNETCQTSKNLKVDKCPFVSQPMIKNQSASTDSGPITLIDKEKINIGTVLLLGNCTLRDLSESQLPENRESKEGNEA